MLSPFRIECCVFNSKFQHPIAFTSIASYKFGYDNLDLLGAVRWKRKFNLFFLYAMKCVGFHRRSRRLVSLLSSLMDIPLVRVCLEIGSITYYVTTYSSKEMGPELKRQADSWQRSFWKSSTTATFTILHNLIPLQPKWITNNNNLSHVVKAQF